MGNMLMHSMLAGAVPQAGCRLRPGSVSTLADHDPIVQLQSTTNKPNLTGGPQIMQTAPVAQGMKPW